MLVYSLFLNSHLEIEKDQLIEIDFILYLPSCMNIKYFISQTLVTTDFCLSFWRSKCSTNIRNEFLCFGGKVNFECSSGFVMHKDRRVSNKLSFLIQQCTAGWAGQWVKMFTFHVVDDAGFSTSFKVSFSNSWALPFHPSIICSKAILPYYTCINSAHKYLQII